jgi:hypothetical protein
MENIEPHPKDDNLKPKPIEHDYAAHQDDPGPSPEAIKEDDKEGAGKAMKWIIPIVIIILFIIYWIMF